MLKYNSIDTMVLTAINEGKNISDLVIADQAQELEKTYDELYETMRLRFVVMQDSVTQGMDKHLRSASGLSGGNAYKMQRQVDSGKNICGKLFGSAMAKSLAVTELNSCMGRIVAAPTAGSCGILPAVLLSVMQEYNIDEKVIVKSLFTASAVGMVIANNASISGAKGGCQAECGAGSAMAAAALCEIMGGNAITVQHAVAIALKNILGLVCDPVAGLVEVPCIKRNAMGTANAFVGAELALAGIESIIPADEVIVAMKKIGESMPVSLKETAEGGLAATPTGEKIRKRLQSQ